MIRSTPAGRSPCQHHLPAIGQGTEHAQERRLAVFAASCDIHALGPHVHDLQVLQPALFPCLILAWPTGREPGQRRHGSRRGVPEHTAQGQLEIPARQPGHVHLGQPCAHLARPAFKKRQHATDQALGQPTHAWPAHGDRTCRSTQRPRLPISSAHPSRAIHGGPTRRFRPP
jgi:hypothetical protein